MGPRALWRQNLQSVVPTLAKAETRVRPYTGNSHCICDREMPIYTKLPRAAVSWYALDHQ